MKLSIVIPVYNTSKYIHKCLDSMLNQTLDSTEFIFVDDGSTDNSTEIINKYMKKDKRIKLYKKENGGAATARNYGIKQATGEYIAFADSDDYIDKDMYKIMYDRAKKDDLDMVLCNYYLVYGDKVVRNQSSITTAKEKEISSNEYIMITPSPCNKIVKKSYLDKCKFYFPEGMMYEDLASIPLLGLCNPKVVYINKCLYYYVQSDNSVMRTAEYKAKYEDIFKAIKHLYNHMKDSDYEEELEYLLTYHFLYLGSLNFYKYKKYDNINRIANEMKVYAPNWYKNRIVKEKFTKKQYIYLKLFYYKKYFLISFYQKITKKNEYVE